MMPVEFHKMHGLGNDFILLDLRQQSFFIDKAIARQLSNRHTGVGCDQILILRQPQNEQDLAVFEIWNSDGSRAEQCGNGVRCLGHYLDIRGETPAGPFTLTGVAGTIIIECLGNAIIQVDMGAPEFDRKQVPIALDPLGGWYPLEVDGQSFQLGAVSMGNPHALMVVDSISATDIAGLGAAINGHPAFPEGCNMGFAEIIDRRNIHLRVFERGAAETNACGSGACAAVSILCRAGMVDQRVNVTQRGGDLTITCNGREDSVIMAGLATYVYKGIFT